MIPLTQRPEWQALSRHYAEIKDTHLRESVRVRSHTRRTDGA